MSKREGERKIILDSLQRLENFPANTIFAEGFGTVFLPFRVKWVAVRGAEADFPGIKYPDWAIYYSLDEEEKSQLIAVKGKKLKDKEKIKEFVPCVEEVLDHYRF